jgi:hypothetical protein
VSAPSPHHAPIVIAAYHLPALSHVATTTWSYGSGRSAVHLRIPQLTAQQLRTQTDALIEARGRSLEPRPVREIVAAVDAVAARLQDSRDPLRQLADAALPVVTGYAPAMIARILDAMAADWRAERLLELLRSEFGDPGVLDAFHPREAAGGFTRAFPPRLTTHVFSGNVPGIGVTSLIRSLLVKSGTLGKTAAGEPLLAALFAQALDELDPELGACLAVTYWPGGNEELERVALGAAEAVVVYGGDEVVAAVRARTPHHARFLAYGHKLSFGMIGREALSDAGADGVAEHAALQVATFDQQGCVSPHLFYVEEGGDVSPRDWTARLAGAMARVEATLPRGKVSPSESSAIRQARGEAEFSQLADTGVELHASPDGTAWTVVFDPEPAFSASCLNRLVRVKPVERLEHVAALVRDFGGHLQTVGIAASAARRLELAGTLGRLGASRIAPIGRMAWPPPGWHHDGRPPLGDLVRWCDVEE